jgi:amidophosphoribosyltransferase
VVIPIPDTSRTSAMQVAQHLNVKYREGFVKNRYVGRTVHHAGAGAALEVVRFQAQRHRPRVPQQERAAGRTTPSCAVTTSAQIIDLAREAGARKVYFASAAPPVKIPNVYGIDMPAKSELVASSRSDAEVAQAHRRRLADLPGSSTISSPPACTIIPASRNSILVFLGQLRDRRHHARIPARA